MGTKKYIFWFRLLPILIPWRHHNYIQNGKYVENVVSHRQKYYPLYSKLEAANDD